MVIIGYNNADDIHACLTALAEQDHRDFTVIICENGGEAATRELNERCGGLRPGGAPPIIIPAPDNPGYAGGINRCIAATSNAAAWWVLNPDTRPAPTALSALIRRLDEGDADIVGGQLVLEDGSVQSYGGRWRSRLGRVESVVTLPPADGPATRAAHEAALDFHTGASMLVSACVVATVGPMREDYFLYCEEVEWCVRATDAGLRLGYAEGAVVIHDQGSTTGSGGAVRGRKRLPIYLDERNKLNMVRDLRRGQLVTAVPATFVLALLRYGKAGAWRQLGWALQGWWAGVRDERGKPAWLLRGRTG